MNCIFRSVDRCQLFLQLKEPYQRLSQKLQLYQHYIPTIITRTAKKQYRHAKKTFYNYAVKGTIEGVPPSITWSYLQKITKAHRASLNMLENTLDFQLFRSRLLDADIYISPQTDNEIMDMLDMC